MLEKLSANDLLISPEKIIEDYRCAYSSRQASIIGQREVMSGKAKFGIFGAGKELPQLAIAREFQNGDFRSGYYRDQTFMFAAGMLSYQEFFAQLYAHTNVQAEPATGGRAMNAHFASRSLNADGNWNDLTVQRNSAADVSPTASQMPRAVGLAYASKLYRSIEELSQYSHFSNNGNEVVFATIGDASVAEGLFWESLNAIGVLRCPAIITVYDDGFGISVANEHQVAKENLSDLLEGFRRPPGECCDGYDIYKVKGWDYPALIEIYRKAVSIARDEHMPSLVHVDGLTQPQGHSTSGSHERYKTDQRLAWEIENDCIKRFREWILNENIANDDEIQAIESEAREIVENARKQAWQAYIDPIQEDRRKALNALDALSKDSVHQEEILAEREKLAAIPIPWRRDIVSTLRRIMITIRNEPNTAKIVLGEEIDRLDMESLNRYSSHLYSENEDSALRIPEVKPKYSKSSRTAMGFEILNACFDAALEREPRLIAFGEDLGFLGGVNQSFRGLQKKYGPLRVTDTGIREATILGQAIGMAMRGLRPLAEIQYLDYLLYALQLMSDDLATLRWRTMNGQKAPVIVCTRGHRLEGIWHSGSPMAGIINLVRGMHVLVPRDMTRAAGFYNTLLLAEEPALVVEVLNGYRIKERMPDNIDKITIPLGVPETIRNGEDITLVTYGACCQIVLDAADLLNQVGIHAEVIDVQSLLPFDLNNVILASLKKTSRIAFIDEDVPGGTTAYMMQQVIERQGGYSWLDSSPLTIPAKTHRPAYGSDGDYWSKPNADEIFDKVYSLMHESNPSNYPLIYK